MIDPVLWQRLAEAKTEDVTRRSLCDYDATAAGYVVPMLGGEYLVKPGTRTVETRRAALPDDKPPGFQDELVLVAYLLNAKEIPPAGGDPVPGDRLPDGMFYFRGIHDLPTGKLTDAFGGDPAAFARAGERLGAKRASYGDAALTWAAMPRVPITFVLWAKDDEFPARASVLFDRNAHEQLALDALGGLASLGIKRLVRAGAS